MTAEQAWNVLRLGARASLGDRGYFSAPYLLRAAQARATGPLDRHRIRHAAKTLELIG